MKPFFLIASIIFTVIFKVLSINAVQPNWLSSPYFRANNEKVISTRTGSDQTPEYTFTFSSSLPGMPNLAYGIKGYQGNDFLGQQNFQIRRIDLTTSTFRVSVQIFGVTNLNILNVPYIAIDPTFPHHLNSFDNVPLNYSSGDLTNISNPSTVIQTFTQVINYTEQTTGRTYRQFQLPLQGNKIALFMTSLFINAKFRSGSTYYPVQITLNTTILNQSFYQWRATAFREIKITRFHFSQVVFNSQDVKSSNLYFLEYQIWETDVNGGFYGFPAEFVDNFIMGLMDFKTIDGKCGIQYIWDFMYQNTTHGVRLQPSFITYGDCGLKLMRSTIFYMRTWDCPTANNFFNLSASLCQDACADYFYQNDGQSECTPCHYSCQDCINASQTQCYKCNEDNDHRYLIDDGRCTCMKGYFDDGVNSQCADCTSVLPFCLDCQYNPNFTDPSANGIDAVKFGCKQCQSTKFYNQSSFKCQNFVECNSSNNYFINNTINQCQICTLNNCISCVSLYSCSACDQTNKYFLNTTTIVVGLHTISVNQCVSCIPSIGCLECLNLTACQTCDSNNSYFVDPYDPKKCVACTLPIGCLKCQDLTTCQQCDQTNKYFSDIYNSAICKKCVEPEGCMECKNLTACANCNNSNGYFMNTTDQTCIDCSPGCILCDINLGKCTSCQGTMILNTITGKCECQNGQSLDLVMRICNLCHDECLTCVGSSNLDCRSCHPNQNRILQGSQCICNPNGYQQSVDTNSYVCTQICQIGYNYVMYNSSCLEICGDGKLFNLQCDDGNIYNGDGCSKNCTIQQDYECDNEINRNPASICRFLNKVTFINTKVSKQPNGNMLQVTIQIEQNLSIFNILDWKNQLEIVGADLSIFSARYQNGKLILEIQGDQDISNLDISIRFKGNATLTDSTPLQSTQIGFKIDTSQPTKNNLNPIYYPQTVYSQAEFASILVMVSMGIGLFGAFISLASKNSLPTLQLIIAMQTIFLSLSTLVNMNPITAAILKAQFITGYNQKNFNAGDLQNIDQLTTPNVHVLGYQTSFFNDFNIMLAVEVVLLLLSFILFISYQVKEEMQEYFLFFQREAMLVILFNSPNAIFSISLMQFDHPLEIGLAIFAVIVIFVQAIHLLVRYKYYLGFQTSFQYQNSSFRFFFVALLCFKTSLCLVYGILKQNTFISCIVVLCLQILSCVLLTIIRVYKDKYANLMTLLGQYFILGFLIINEVFAILRQSNSNLKSEMLLSWFQIGLFFGVAILTLLSALVAIYFDYFYEEPEDNTDQTLNENQDKPTEEYCEDFRDIFSNHQKINNQKCSSLDQRQFSNQSVSNYQENGQSNSQYFTFRSNKVTNCHIKFTQKQVKQDEISSYQQKDSQQQVSQKSPTTIMNKTRKQLRYLTKKQ